MEAAEDQSLTIVAADPLGPDALALLHEAAIQAQALYPELHRPDRPAPTNAPLPPRGQYLVAFVGGHAVGMGAHYPIDATCTELRRMFVRTEARGRGVARALVAALEAHARAEGFKTLLLETGYRQQPAMRLYECCGYSPCAPYGPHAGDPTSRCYTKALQSFA